MWFSPEAILAGVMIVALIVYALTGGADYGGGVWDLFASGARKQTQRDLIAHAIGPIWEANHVWLILVVVLLFTAFPAAFAVIATALHIPLTLMLLGVVLRGSAFTFRSYDRRTDDVQRRWGRVFSISSLITPVLLGITAGAISSGNVRMKNGVVVDGFFASWLAPFPFAVGVFTLVLFAFIAAVYLAVETDDEQLREDFRQRALISAVACGVMALTVFLLSASGAPLIRQRLSESWWTWPLQITTGLFAVGAIAALWLRQYRAAQLCATLQVTLILCGWAAAQFPFVVPPELSIYNTAAPQVTLRLVLYTLLAGSVLLLPSFYYLFRLFKSHPRRDSQLH